VQRHRPAAGVGPVTEAFAIAAWKHGDLNSALNDDCIGGQLGDTRFGDDPGSEGCVGVLEAGRVEQGHRMDEWENWRRRTRSLTLPA